MSTKQSMFEGEFVPGQTYRFKLFARTRGIFNRRNGKKEYLFFKEGFCIRYDLKRDGYWFHGTSIKRLGKEGDAFTFLVKRGRFEDGFACVAQFFRVIEGGGRGKKHELAQTY